MVQSFILFRRNPSEIKYQFLIPFFFFLLNQYVQNMNNVRYKTAKTFKANCYVHEQRGTRQARVPAATLRLAVPYQPLISF